jgi:hypothetical protein
MIAPPANHEKTAGLGSRFFLLRPLGMLAGPVAVTPAGRRSREFCRLP